MEEYVYDYLLIHAASMADNMVYIPIFWTNLQNHPGFSKMKSAYHILLQRAIHELHDSNVRYFTVVQHDDGPQLDLPPHTIIFGACTGTIPLPLLYEDTRNTLLSSKRLQKDILASFIGSMTHPVRDAMCAAFMGHDDIFFQGKKGWTHQVPDSLADQFIHYTLRSKFCLAPRGYGRSSFRFFEAILLDTIPVYIWDDVCWLPYQDSIDYSTFSVCISSNDIHRLHDILTGISEETYERMRDALQKIRPMFTLQAMCEYIVSYCS
jgi:hypothetical protein